MVQNLIVPVILCGGSGTRLWPASREKHPKQFLSLMNDFSLLQNTMRRALRLCDADPSALVTVTLASLRDSVAAQLAEIDETATDHILCEPMARNTAAAVALAAEYVRRVFGQDAIMWVLPADHHIANENALALSLHDALPFANNGQLVTFGITPTRPDTGYGYIRANMIDAPVLKVEEFVEKPNLETAQKYVADGNYLWNSGMFLFTAKSVLAHYKTLNPRILEDVVEAMKSGNREPNAKIYGQIEEIPFDMAIMEKSDSVSVAPCNPDWSDIGSWESLWEIKSKDTNGNAADGKVAFHNAHGCLVQGKDRLIAVAGLENIVVIETEDAMLITDKTDSDSMRALVKALKKVGSREVIEPPSMTPSQPWSLVKSLPSEQPYMTKEIVIKAGEKKSFDAQSGGLCLYTVLEGKATFSIDGMIKHITTFESLNVQATAGYSIINRGMDDLKMLEVRKTKEDGIYFGTPVVPSEQSIAAIKKLA